MKMSIITSIHDILDKEDWNFQEFNSFLEQDASSINMMDRSGCYPLLRLLANERCSVDMVNLFLQYGADINIIMNRSIDTLFFSICKRGWEICRIFWEKIVDSNAFDNYFEGRSPLCVFLNTDMQPQIIKIVLNTDDSPNACKKHPSPLHCAMMVPNTKFKKEMCQILIYAGHSFGMHMINDQEQSFLCYALSQGAGPEVIKLFLNAGCPLRACIKHVSALHCAMYSEHLKSKEKIFAMLIEAGLGVFLHRRDSEGRSFFCNAMRFGAEPGAIKLLLAKGCIFNGCSKHLAGLNCAMGFQDSKYKIDVCRMLIEAGSDLNELDIQGRPPICNALQHGAEPELFKLLLDAGSSLEICMKHRHPLFCATMHSGVLRADTLQLLIDAYEPLQEPNAKVYNNFLDGPMRCALKECVYETEAIKLLSRFEEKEFERFETVLHVAVRNRQCCKPDAVQFLIDQGNSVRATDYRNDNSLQLAIGNNCQSDVIEVLVRNADFDYCQNHSYKTPIEQALTQMKDANYLEVMLKAGAPLTSLNDPEGSQIMLTALIRYYVDKSQERIDICKVLLKHIYLENPKFKMNSLTGGRKCYKIFLDFAKECVREIKVMESNNYNDNCTLYELIRKSSPNGSHEIQNLCRRGSFSKISDLDQLLKILAENSCHLYLDILSTKICKKAVKIKLLNMSIYTIREDTSSTEMRIVLNRDCVYKIAEYLSEDELLKFAIAFYISDKRIHIKHSKQEKRGRKRKSEQPCRLCICKCRRR